MMPSMLRSTTAISVQPIKSHHFKSLLSEDEPLPILTDLLFNMMTDGQTVLIVGQSNCAMRPFGLLPLTTPRGYTNEDSFRTDTPTGLVCDTNTISHKGSPSAQQKL